MHIKSLFISPSHVFIFRFSLFPPFFTDAGSVGGFDLFSDEDDDDDDDDDDIETVSSSEDEDDDQDDDDDSEGEEEDGTSNDNSTQGKIRGVGRNKVFDTT